MFWCLFLVMVSLSWLSNISTQWGLVLLVLDVDFCLWPCLVEPYMSKWLYARQLPIRTHFTASILILFIILSKIWSVCLEKEKKIELLMRAQNCFISDGSLKINTIPCWYKLSVFLVLIFFFFFLKRSDSLTKLTGYIEASCTWDYLIFYVIFLSQVIIYCSCLSFLHSCFWVSLDETPFFFIVTFSVSVCLFTNFHSSQVEMSVLHCCLIPLPLITEFLPLVNVYRIYYVLLTECDYCLLNFFSNGDDSVIVIILLDLL